MRKMNKIAANCCSVLVVALLLGVWPRAASATDTVVTFGDSITAGYGSVPYSTYLQQKVGSQATLVNEGLPGEFTGDGANRISSVLSNDHPKYILIMEGANDADWGFSASTVKFNLGVMVDKSIAAGAIPIISTVTPNIREQLTVSIENDYNPNIAALAAEKGITLVDSYGAVVANWPNLTFDGLHPNEEGAKILANVFFAALPYRDAGGGSSSGGGGGCFIATAAFGSDLAPKVVLLKQFRDRFLLTNKPGTLFVKLYYRFSPPLAHFIAKHDLLRAGIRLMLYPLITLAYALLHPAFALHLFCSVFALLAGVFVVKRLYGRNSHGE